MKAVIATPTGRIGSQLTGKLLDAGEKPVLLARDPSKVRNFVDRGAVVRQGDLTNRDFVTEATAGADVLFWLSPPNYTAMDFRAYQNNLGNVAAHAIDRNRIPYVVNLSSTGAHSPSGNGPVNGLYDIEKTLNGKALNVLHLRPTAFMENLLMSLETIKSAGSIFLPVGGGTKVPMVATADIADVAAKSILNPNWSGRNVKHIFGPVDYTHDKAAEILSHLLETEVNFVQVTSAQAREAMTRMGMSPDVADQFVELYESFDAGRFLEGVDNPEVRGDVTLEQFTREVVRPIFAG